MLVIASLNLPEAEEAEAAVAAEPRGGDMKRNGTAANDRARRICRQLEGEEKRSRRDR